MTHSESGNNERTVPTFCRVCEPACGLVATVASGRDSESLVKIAPDREHPITQGFACHKGIRSLEVHHDPDRLNAPQLRRPDGTFEEVGWDAAISEIGKRLRVILEQSGPDAVSAYVGNPSGFNVLARPAIQSFLRELGVRRTFGSGTQDCANKFAGSEAIFGSSTIHPVPDIENTDYLLILGENPAVSHMSFLAIADPMSVLRAAARRGATIRFIDPRKIESATESVGDVVQIRPDTDLYLLAAMLHEIDRTVGFDSQAVAQHGKNLDQLRQFVAAYPVERAAAVTGIAADTIRELASDFATAASASIHMSTGVNMGRQGTLCYWLLHMLSLLTGNLDKKGGNVLSEGFYLSAKAGRGEFERNRQSTPWGSLRSGQLPGNLISEAILDQQTPIRALFVVAGNPVLTIGGEEKMRQAFESLDLLVVVDLYRNATGEMAHACLPATDMFERPDFNLVGLGLQHRPYAQWTDRVVQPQAERKEEWWIFARLAQEMGLPSVLDLDVEKREAALWGKIDHMLKTRGNSLEKVKSSAHGIDFGAHQPGRFFSTHLQTEDKRVDCCPAPFAEALERAEEICRELEQRAAQRRPGEMLLISRRDKYMHNSWYANLESMKPSYHDRTFVWVHPQDASALGLEEGQQVLVSNENGSIEVELRFDPDLLTGVVAIPHGWGNQRTSGMRVAQRTAGSNVNRLLPSGVGSFEPLSSQAHMTGIPVRLSAEA